MKTKTELIKYDQGLDLESGEKLDTFDLMVETYGQLNADKDNGILICHAFSGNHHAAGKTADGINFLIGSRSFEEISSIN